MDEEGLEELSAGMVRRRWCMLSREGHQWRKNGKEFSLLFASDVNETEN